MDTCLCERCLGIYYTNRGRKNVVAVREPIERLENRLGRIANGCGNTAFLTVALIIVGFAWHAACLALGWQDPTSQTWVYGMVIGTFVTSLLGAMVFDDLSFRLHKLASLLEMSENDLAQSTSNATYAQSDLRRKRDHLRLIA